MKRLGLLLLVTLLFGIGAVSRSEAGNGRVGNLTMALASDRLTSTGTIADERAHHIARASETIAGKPRCPACPKKPKPGSCKAECPSSPALAAGQNGGDCALRREWQASGDRALSSAVPEPELPPPRT